MLLYQIQFHVFACHMLHVMTAKACHLSHCAFACQKIKSWICMSCDELLHVMSYICMLCVIFADAMVGHTLHCMSSHVSAWPLWYWMSWHACKIMYLHVICHDVLLHIMFVCMSIFNTCALHQFLPLHSTRLPACSYTQLQKKKLFYIWSCQRLSLQSHWCYFKTLNSKFGNFY